MRFGTRRGLPLALALGVGLGLGWASSARAIGFVHTIPRVVDAYDYTTGGAYMAPPIPYGHYAKDYVDEANRALGCVTCRLHALCGAGGLGHGLFHHGQGSGDGNCDGAGCGHGLGHGHEAGLFGHHGGTGCGVAGCGGGMSCGLLGHHGQSAGGQGADGYACTGVQSSAQAVAQPSGQAACGLAGCGVKGRHSHLGHGGGHAGSGWGDPCGDPSCRGGHGLGHGHGFGHGHGTGCGFCGGKGCANCLKSLASGLHGKLAGALAGLVYRPRVQYFLGAGGPVPLTPGYVPYIVTTRSPRDYFAFAPMNPNDR
jgi:hypothetical protein